MLHHKLLPTTTTTTTKQKSSPSYALYLKLPRPLAPLSRTNLHRVYHLRTRRSKTSSDQHYFSSQFYSAENFSSFIAELDPQLSGDTPVREISDQELTRLGFPIPTVDPVPETTQRAQNNFPIVDSPFFQIISREYDQRSN